MNSTKMPGFQFQDPAAYKKSPRGFQQLSPDILQIRSGGGLLSFFGLPFLAAGIFLILAATQIIPFDNADEVPAWAYPLIGLMAVAFTGVGGWLFLGRTWIIINRRTGTIEQAKGLLVPLKRESQSVRPYDRVVMLLNEGDSDSPDRYPVLLRGFGKQYSISDAPDYKTCYAQATLLAEFLSLSLEDATTPNARRVAATELAATLAQRAEQTKLKTGWANRPGRPFRMKSAVEQLNGELRITVPHDPPTLWRLIPGLIPLGFAIYFLSGFTEFLDRSDTPKEVQWGIYAFVGFFFVFLPLMGVLKAFLRSRFGYHRLTISSHQLTISSRSIVSTRAQSVDVTDVLDIDYHTSVTTRTAARREALDRTSDENPGRRMSPEAEQTLNKVLHFVGKYVRSKGMVIKTKQGLHYFAAGLPDDEVAYLASEVKNWIARRS